ncbi:hypothetical protein DMH04_13505 [Kibdelosporangium aridum]|uniref:2'-5' RNA ligase n=1 Tax=Kibdelosporangium aridum TaxID=2030 RepID=A0A428ZEX3_KIBAR|nr:hypothetical protein DMH04_13505 [Kibdelosporangium aridum]
MTRLAIAIWPPPRIVATVRKLPRPAGPAWASPEQWMVKLRPLGHVPADVVADLTEALGAQLEDAEEATCVLGPHTRMLGGQWLGIPVAGLDDLAATVFDATISLVPVTHPQPFQADIVIARGKVPKTLAGEPVSGTWHASTVHLVADRSSPRGPKFENLAEFRLSSPSHTSNRCRD